MFAAKHTFEDQPRLTARAFEIAGAPARASFACSPYWRTVEPEACFDRIVDALRALADQAAPHDVIIGLENEHACNIATAAETARVLAALDHPNLKVVWDPANALVSGEKAFPEGYGKLPRVAHRACACEGLHRGRAQAPLGPDRRGRDRLAGADRRAGARRLYRAGSVWKPIGAGPGGDKHEASMICGRNPRQLVGQ